MLWKVRKNQKVAISHIAIEIESQVTHHIVVIDK